MPIKKTNNKKDGKIMYYVRVNWTTPSGEYKQQQRTAYGLQEAKELETAMLRELRETASKSLTIQSLYDEYTSAKKNEVRQSTLEKSKTILKNHVLPDMGKIKLGRLGVPQLQKWKLSIDDKELSLIMKKNIFGEFRTLLNYAVKMEYLPTNPLLKIGNFKSTIQQRKEMLFYTPEEFNKFIAAAKEQAQTKQGLEWDYYIFFMIAWWLA